MSVIARPRDRSIEQGSVRKVAFRCAKAAFSPQPSRNERRQSLALIPASAIAGFLGQDDHESGLDAAEGARSYSLISVPVVAVLEVSGWGWRNPGFSDVFSAQAGSDPLPNADPDKMISNCAYGI